jgi:hypothetical protein
VHLLILIISEAKACCLKTLKIKIIIEWQFCETIIQNSKYITNEIGGGGGCT